ncbi:DUF6232 family protein [Flavitalea flava]
MAKNKQEYSGDLTLTNKTISFKGTTIQLKSIARFQQFELTRINSIGIPLMLVAGLAIIIFMNYLFWGLIFIVPAALIIYAGIKERQKPKLYEIVLELASGGLHNIVSADEQGIRSLYSKIKEAMQNEENPINYHLNFKSGKIDFNTGDTYNVKDSQIGALGNAASASGTIFNTTYNKPS